MLSSTFGKVGIEWRSNVSTVDLSFAKNLTIEKRVRKNRRAPNRCGTGVLSVYAAHEKRRDVTDVSRSLTSGSKAAHMLAPRRHALKRRT